MCWQIAREENLVGRLQFVVAGDGYTAGRSTPLGTIVVQVSSREKGRMVQRKTGEWILCLLLVGNIIALMAEIIWQLQVDPGESEHG